MAVRHRQRVLIVIATCAVIVGSCIDDPQPQRAERKITIPDLTGLSRDYAIRLIDNLELDIHIEHVHPRDVEGGDVSSAELRATRLANDVVLMQKPPPDTKVVAGGMITLLVAEERTLREDEEKYRLITHCGLSFPLEYDHQFWLPVDRKLRQSVNPPEGFSSDGFYDNGTVRRVDDYTLIYTSSSGVQVEYEPTTKRPRGCE